MDVTKVRILLFLLKKKTETFKKDVFAASLAWQTQQNPL